MTGIGVGVGIPFLSAHGGGLAQENVLVAARGVYAFNGQSATLVHDFELPAESATFSISGTAASLLMQRDLVAQGASYTFSGTAADLLIETPPVPGEYTINAQFGAFTFSGDTMTPVVDYIIPTEAATFAISGTAAGLEVNHLLTAAGTTFAVSGTDAELTPGSNYTGPGDTISGALAFWSVARAYDAAFAASEGAVMKLVDQAGGNAITINILTTGFVDVASISAWVSANSVTTIRVNELYDQTGNAVHMTNSTLSQMPSLVLNSLNGLPTMHFSSSRTDRLATANFTRSQPMNMTAVAKRTGNFTGQSGILGAQSQSVDLQFSGTSGNAEIGAGTLLARAAANSTWHSLIGVFNSGSSAIVTNGTATTGNAGSNNISSTPLRMGRNSGGGPLDGDIAEVSIYPGSAWNATQYGNMDSNMRDATNGYNF